MPAGKNAARERPAEILVVDDEEGMRDFLSICLSKAGHRTHAVSSGELALKHIASKHYDVVITDLTMPGISGMEVLRGALAQPNAPLVIMITAFATTDTAIEAMKLGAYDYLYKPFNVEAIEVVVVRALERVDLTTENQRLREQLRGVQSLDRMVGRSTAMLKVFELVRKVAPTRANVLLRGESGTGKELVARALHAVSDRRSGPFVAINCGAIPENLMESELFGHVRGAFTGANVAREGVFLAARGGTLFLDEIGELSLAMQVKLLRALQDKRVRPVGSSQELEADARVVAATNRDLEAAMEAGEFRSDLYFRLDVVQIVLPPLRHRTEDIPLLVERSFKRINKEMGRDLTGIAPEAMQWLLDHDYPGNVRELENLVERGIALETGTTLSAENFPARRPTKIPGGGTPEPELGEGGIDLEQVVADLERRLITAALKRTRGVRKDAAKLLGVSFRSLRYRLDKLGITVPSGRGPDADNRAGS